MGAFLITSGLSLFSFALTQSGLVEKGWRTPCTSSYNLIMRQVSNILTDIPVVLVISILMIVLYGFWEHFVEKKTSIPPLSRLAIFSRRQWKVTAILIVSFFAYVPIAVSHRFELQASPLTFFSGLDVPHNYLVPELQTGKRSHERCPHLTCPHRRCHSLCACSSPRAQDSRTISFDVRWFFDCCRQLAPCH